MVKRTHIFYFIYLTALALVLNPCCRLSSFAAEPGLKEFYYYNPDSLQSNLSHLKAEIDGLLSDSGFPIKFQAFAHYIDFDKSTYLNKPAFLIIPDWYLKKHGARLQIKPLLQPSRNKSSEYTKLLLIKKNSGIAFKNMRTRSLAMTTMGPDSETILNRILFSRHNVDAKQLSIVNVPKDSDALFALALGQVDIALVTKQNIDALQKINPNVLNAVTTLDESLPLSLPIFCYLDGSASRIEIKKIKNIFLNLNNQKSVIKAMEMLQIDEWKTIDY